DKDGDGQVSLREWLAGRRKPEEFRLYDLNDDGFITPDEVLLREKDNAKYNGSLPKGLPAWFKQLDKDRDGQVSLQEWLDGGKEPDEFPLYDLNDDGFITADELLRIVKKARHLEFVKGEVNYRGAIEESTDERYQGKKSFTAFTIKLEAGKT